LGNAAECLEKNHQCWGTEFSLLPQQAAGDCEKCEYPGLEKVTDLLSTVATLSQEGHIVKVAAGSGM
jgi:hypothetical protein